MDFSKSKYDCRLKDSDFIFNYSDLKIMYDEIAEIQPPIHQPLSEIQLLKFVVLSYHIYSPLAREGSIHQRRRQALAFLGYNLTTKKEYDDNKPLVALIAGSNSFVNRLCIHFCKFENNIDWMELCSLQDMLDDVYLTLKEETEGTDKKSAQEILKLKIEIRSKAQPLREQMRELSRQLFQNDLDMINHTAAYMVLEKRTRLITPEDIAKYSIKEVIEDLKERINN